MSADNESQGKLIIMEYEIVKAKIAELAGQTVFAYEDTIQLRRLRDWMNGYDRAVFDMGKGVNS